MVKKKLNNRGYVLMEIIMASVIAFGIVYYILDLTIKLKNKNDDLFVQTVIETDQAIIQNKVTKIIDQYGYGKTFVCSPIPFTVNGKVLYHNGSRIDTVSQYVTIDNEHITCNINGGIINIAIPLKAGNNTYYARINYVIKSS